MTISATQVRKTFTGDGSTAAFTYNYRFLANADLKVYQEGTLKTITTHYTVTGAGDAGGGTVTFVTAPALNDEIVILNDPASTQSLDLVDNDIFPAESLEAVLDRQTLQIQRCRDLIGRSMTLSDTDTTGASVTLPTPEANGFWRWNAAGTAVEWVQLDLESAGAAALKADLANGGDAAKGSSLVGFLQAGTGAVARTVQSKSREWVSVADFGAIGDGTLHTVQEWIIPGALGRYASLAALQVDYPHVTATTDSIDWAAFQAAMAASVKVRVPKATYHLNKGLTVSQRYAHLIGEGGDSRLVFYGDTVTTAMTVTESRVNITGLRFYGNGHATQVVTGIKLDGVVIYSEFDVWLQYFSGWAVDAGVDVNKPANGNKFRVAALHGGNGLKITYGTKNTIADCDFEDLSGTAISILLGAKNVIENNYFENNGTLIELSTSGTNGTTIRGNYLRRWSTAGISLGQYVNGTLIEGNYFSTDAGSPSTAIVENGATNTVFGAGNIYEGNPLARGTHVSMQGASSVIALGAWKGNNVLLNTGGPLSTSGTTETDLATVTVPGKALGLRSAVRMEANGDMTGTTGNHVINVYFGATVIAALTTTSVLDWSITAEVFQNNAYNAQEVLVRVVAGTTTQVLRATAAGDTSADVVFKITGQAAAGDTVRLRHAKSWYDETI